MQQRRMLLGHLQCCKLSSRDKSPLQIAHCQYFPNNDKDYQKKVLALQAHQQNNYSALQQPTVKINKMSYGHVIISFEISIY